MAAKTVLAIPKPDMRTFGDDVGGDILMMWRMNVSEVCLEILFEGRERYLYLRGCKDGELLLFYAEAVACRYLQKSHGNPMESKAIRDLVSSDVCCDPSGLCMFAAESTTAEFASHIIIIRVTRILSYWVSRHTLYYRNASYTLLDKRRDLHDGRQQAETAWLTKQFLWSLQSTVL